MADPVTTSTAFWDLKATEVMKFISTLISSLAWPLATFFILRLFKAEILKLIPLLSKLKALGIEAEFNRGLAKAEEEVAKIANSPNSVVQNVSPLPPYSDLPPPPSDPAPLPPGPMPSPESSGVTSQDAPAPILVSADLEGTYSIGGPSEPDPVALQANPTGSVMVSWNMLEQALHLLAQSLNGSLGPIATFRPKQLVVFLRDAGLLKEEEVQTLMGLIELRNLAAHSSGKAISEAEADRFHKVARKLTGLYTIRAAQRNLSRKLDKVMASK
jgi:hypothetical protein